MQTSTQPQAETVKLEPPPNTAGTLTRRIGSTTYRVRVHYSQTSKETMNDKIVRMMKNEAAGKAAS
jgi:hypothetical protein